MCISANLTGQYFTRDEWEKNESMGVYPARGYKVFFLAGSRDHTSTSACFTRPCPRTKPVTARLDSRREANFGAGHLCHEKARMRPGHPDRRSSRPAEAKPKRLVVQRNCTELHPLHAAHPC